MAKDTTKIKVVEKTPGRPHIDFAVSGGKKVTFGDDELTINLAARERDEAVTLDICIDAESGIVIGVGGTAQRYAAQIDIPARRPCTPKDRSTASSCALRPSCLIITAAAINKTRLSHIISP